MEDPESVMNHIKSELESLKYGRVIVEIQEYSNKIDVLTETRQRFPVNGEKN